MCQCKLWEFSVFFACFCVYSVTTFNVDSFNYASYNGLDSSMFGFSMALHKERNNRWLIVGAPEGQSSHQRRVVRGGVVYKCPTDRDGGCQEIAFDTHDDIIDQTTGQQLDNKTEQWFGATVSSSGREEGSIVACAPRYTWYPRNKSRRDPVGTCYVSNAMLNRFNEYSPCRTYQWGYHRQGSCQAGFSAAINSVGNRLFIGAPGSWYWQGQMYSIDAHAEFEFKPLLFSATYGAEGQVHQQSLETRAPVFATTEGTEKDDDSYMGYSTIVGDFLDNKDPKDESIAVGMPRGNSLKGVVIIFTWNLTDVRHLPGDQLGSYFGYALASSDVDGDGKVDLIVGSPMYTVPNNKDKFDMGRVYVIYHSNNTVRGTFMVNDTIDGFNSRSRFGQALAALGDINQDGYQDFAVGAPYDGTGNRGAVYIYHGSSKGVRQKYSQVIFAEDIVPYPAGALTTFGFSITGGLDLDDNEYPDMAVGAYLSNKAFFFRSRPVIRVDAWVVFVADNKEIDIAKSNHVVRNRTSSGNNQAVKTEIQFCARYYGKGIPGSINLDLQYILDSKKLLNPRMFFVETEGVNVRNDSIRLFVNRTGCSNETKKIEVYVMTDIHDKLTPLVAEVKYWMKSDADLHPLTYQQNRNPRSILVPVLDLNSPPSKKDTIKIYKDCGDDKICIPDLSLEVKPNVEQYMLDSKDNLELDITVLNTKEDAYDSTFEVHYPEGLNYINYVIIKVETSFSCTENGNRTIRCEIGNPVPNNKIVHFKIVWKSVGQLLVNPTSYDFVLKVNSTNPEDPHTLADNIRKISVGILYDYHPEISGKSIPPEIFYSSNVYTVDISNQTRYTSTADRLPEEVIGPWVVHVYYLTNEGKSAIEETELFFVWPGHMLSEGSEDFLYLVEPPRFSSSENLKIRCGPIPVNQRDFEVVLHNKTIWERYHIDIGQERAGSSKQVMTTASPVSTGEESSTAASETKVKAVVGGGTATTNEAINTAVAQGGDISEVNRKRNLTSEEMKIQISQKQFGQGGNSIEIGHARYYYRCLQTLNGRERQIDCGPYFSSFSTLEAVRLMEQGGDFQRECLMEINGVTKIVDCTTLFTNLHDSTRVALQIGHHQAGFGGGNRQTIGNKQYYYRCVQTINGEQKIVPCELYFSSQYISNLLQQSGDLAQHKCMTQGADGKLVAVDCGVLIANQRGAIKVQVSHQPSGARANTIKIGNTQYYYRCLQTINGNEREIDCGPYFSSLSTSTSTSDIIKMLQQGGIFQRECSTEINGITKNVDCATLFANQQQGGTGGAVTLHFSQGQADLAGDNHKTIGNKQYYYRCTQTVNGEQKVVPCEPYFTSEYITNFLQQSGGLAQHKCMMRTASGKLETVDCGSLFTGQPRGIKVQVSQRQSGRGDSTIRIGNTKYYYRCLQTVDGNEREVDCGPYFSSTSDIIKILQQGGNFQRECSTEINGITKNVDCTTLFANQHEGSTGGAVTLHFSQGQGGLGGSNYQTIGNKQYYYRCVQAVNGEQKEVPCEPYFSSEYITRLLQQGGNLIQHKCMMRTPSGKLETVDCATQQEIKAAVATKVQISQGQDVFGGNRIGNTQYYYRCVQTINGRQQEVACGPQFSLEYVTQLLQQGASAQHECVRRTASGRMETVDCANIHENENEHQMNLLNVRYRCFLIINREYHDRNCESSELLQKVEPDGPMGLCLRSVDGGAEQSVSCAEVVKIHQYGSSQNFGYGYNQSLYDGSQQNYGFETNTYGDDLRRRQQGHRNPQTYGTYGGSRNHLNTQFSGAEGAALGGSFQTGVLNLDTLGANHHGGGYETNTYEEDGFTVRQQSRQDEFDETIGRDNVPTDKPSSNKRWYGRKKRQTIDHHPSIAEIQQQYPCSSVQCTYMRCTVQNLSHEDRLVIALRGRINVRVFEKMGFSDSMSFSSMMISRVRKLPHQQNLKDQEPVFHEVVTTVKRTKEEFKSEMVPLWVVVLSAVAGTIILLLLVFLLYKFGFFKRNRPSSAPERQPLNRNGYHHGDEVL